MDLRNKRISLGELLANPASKRVLMRRFPQAMAMPIVAVSSALSLDRVIKMASAYVSPQVISATIKELEEL